MSQELVSLTFYGNLKCLVTITELISLVKVSYESLVIVIVLDILQT